MVAKHSNVHLILLQTHPWTSPFQMITCSTHVSGLLPTKIVYKCMLNHINDPKMWNNVKQSDSHSKPTASPEKARLSEPILLFFLIFQPLIQSISRARSSLTCFTAGCWVFVRCLPRSQRKWRHRTPWAVTPADPNGFFQYFKGVT